jgi:hypothetical protein
MSATNAPFGMRPAFHPSGLDRAVCTVDGILSTYGTAILKGQPVKLDTTGVIQVAAAGDAFLGAFAGVEWTDTTGRRRVSNNWPASTAYVAGSCNAYYYSDPNIVYEMQTDGTVAQTIIGAMTDLSNTTAGSTTTGLSACTLNATPAAAGASAQMQVLNLAPYADNAWGDAYVILQVRINESQVNASINGV